MTSKFLTPLELECFEKDGIWRLLAPLVYYSAHLSQGIEIPEGFYTDLASVPRIPFIYSLWGDRSHYEAVVHDYLYRSDSFPLVSCSSANKIFKEAMYARNKPKRIALPMYWGVCLGGWRTFHKRKVGDILK